MLVYPMNRRGDTPLYEYLYQCIRDDILTGTLKASQKLPSKRQMASDNGIAVITVENAYAQLVAEGYITSIAKRGYFINDLTLDTTPADSTLNHTTSVKKKETTFRDEIAADVNPATSIDFSSNHARRDSFPFSVWTKLTRQILSEDETKLLISPPSKGVWELRLAISQYLYHSRKMEIDPHQIIVGPGTDYLHMILVQLIGRNRFSGVEDPGYQKAGHIYETNGMKCIHIPVDKDGLMVEHLKNSNIKLLHVSPSHHFPTGCTMPIKRRLALIDWAQKEHAYIVEDDYDSEFRFSGKPLPTLASLNHEHIIYMNTFSKTLVPSIRIAYMVLPWNLMEKYNRKMKDYSGTVSSLEQYTLAKFMSGGHYERHINRMRNYYRKHRSHILHAIYSSPLQSLTTIEESESGLHFILKINKDMDDAKFLDELKNEGIKIAAVSQYCVHNSNQFMHRFIINYSALDETKLAHALNVIYSHLT